MAEDIVAMLVDASDAKELKNLPKLKTLDVGVRVKHRKEFDEKVVQIKQDWIGKFSSQNKKDVNVPFIATIAPSLLKEIVHDCKEYNEATVASRSKYGMLEEYVPELPDFKPDEISFFSPNQRESETSAAWRTRKANLSQWEDWLSCRGDFDVTIPTTLRITEEALVAKTLVNWSGNVMSNIKDFFRRLREDRETFACTINAETDKVIVKQLMKKETLVHPILKGNIVVDGGSMNINEYITWMVRNTTEFKAEEDLRGFQTIVVKAYQMILKGHPSAEQLRDYTPSKPKRDLKQKTRGVKDVTKGKDRRGKTGRDEPRKRQKQANGRNRGKERTSESDKNSVITYVMSLKPGTREKAIARLRSLAKNDSSVACQICGEKDGSCGGIEWNNPSTGERYSQPTWKWLNCKKATPYEKNTKAPYGNYIAWRKAIKHDWSTLLSTTN